MSGSAYYDDCSCGQPFHESELGDHWPHVQQRKADLLGALEIIAAAQPDRWMSQEIADGQSARDIARAAIDKARGRV